MTAPETSSLNALVEAFFAWLQNHPEGDPQDFADDHGITLADLSHSWNDYHVQGDFSRNYDTGPDTYTSQYGAQGAAQAAPPYTPSEPPPYGASPEVYHHYLTQEVTNFQQFVTVNDIDTTTFIEDNSFNQQIVGSNVAQDIDIDNSDVTQGDNSVNIDESTLTDSQVNTGDVGPEGVLQQGDDNVANTGDVLANDGSAASVFGDATTIGSGNDNFGDGQQGINTAVGDGNQQANQQQDNDTDVTIGDTTGGTGGAGTGGAGGDGGSGGFAGDGGTGGSADTFGAIGDGDTFGGFGGDAGGGDADGGAGGAGGAGTGGDANADVDVDVTNEQNLEFS